ncbi:MAG: ThiF family adenylyltransferase [bacterium]|nr:ThiF family adenylyltransferase [bacterium]
MTLHTFDHMELAPENWRPAFSRTAGLLAALDAEADFELIERRFLAEEGQVVRECLIVDVACDGVPKFNRSGIRYRERLALVISSDERCLVEAYVLRADFPVLLHMNGTPPGHPLSLCLYFGSASAVLRTWTSPKFLRRIQWWLTEAAHETLHAADQPVEQLFYFTRHELVLPHDFAARCLQPDTEFRITQWERRPNGEQTLVLQAVSPGLVLPGHGISVIALNLATVVHGPIERVPATLGALDEAMARRGVDLFTQLRQAFIDRMPADGLARPEKDHLVVLVLRIAISRLENGPPEKEQYQAFIFSSKRLELGKLIGAYIEHENLYYIDSLLQQPDVSVTAYWRAEVLDAVDILFFNGASQARRQSGIADAGPQGVLVGAGALGSALQDIWSRSGWGQWHVIDNDHIKPHNLVRHRAYAHQVGRPKVDVLVELHKAITQGAVPITAINANASAMEPPVLEVLQGAHLVVDASASLDFPRAASRQDRVGRHTSVFITPDGNGAVLLAEDEARQIRLVTLEGQYYRIIINEAWGLHHLTGHLGTYWSGASCRDISYSLPYSRVLVHAAGLAEQIQQLGSQAEACIKVWQRDPSTGAIALHEAPAMPVRQLRYGELTVILDQGLEQKLFAMRAQQVPNETGGILLGYHDLIEKILVIVDACPAPADSVSTPITFQRGTDGVSERVDEVSRLTANIVSYVGEWHSHPPGVPASPSKDDILQLVQLAVGMAEDGLPAISLIVSEDDIRIFQGEVL